jgi:hypothetical protein
MIGLGRRLLTTVYQPDAAMWLREVPAIDILRRMWIQNYHWDGNQLCWRASDNIPPAAQFISSPYDLEAHYSRKHTTQWVGYKVVFTETCDDDLPQLITNVETTSAPVPDGETTPAIIYCDHRGTAAGGDSLYHDVADPDVRTGREPRWLANHSALPNYGAGCQTPRKSATRLR